LIFYKNKGSARGRTCLLCQQTSLENMNMPSQTAHTKYKWPPYATEWKALPWKFSAYVTDGKFSKRLFSTIGLQNFNQNVGEVACSIYL